MRLIDADKLYLPPEDIGSLMAVAYAPTAYDVDKVIDELKNCRNGKQSPDICKSLSEIDAIKIVKRGGVE